MNGSAVNVTVISGFGINAERELCEAFSLAGGKVDCVHVSDLLARKGLPAKTRILAFPGGFSYGDHLGSGKVLAYQVRQSLRPAIEGFVADGGMVIGICNGFQILVKMGILPNGKADWSQEVSLVHNESGKFEDSWVRVRFNPASSSPWTRGLQPTMYPIRHGEGRFVADAAMMETLRSKNLVAVEYDGRNPNGSMGNIAGITDATGRVFGLMPHPEAYIHPEHHPLWTKGKQNDPLGLELFNNAVKNARTGV